MKERVAIADQSYSVAVQLWPGFNEKFPFHAVEDLPFLGRDVEKSLLAIQQVVAHAHWASRNTIRELQLKRAAKWVEAVKEQSSRRLGGNFSRTYAASVSFRESQLPEKDAQLNRTFEAMAELGWSQHSGLRGGNLPIVSPRMPIIAVDNIDLAQCIVDHLTTLENEYLRQHCPQIIGSILKAKGRTVREFFCPRFSVISTTEMSAAERAVAICSLERLKSASEVTFYSKIARAYRVEAERLVAAWTRGGAETRKDSTTSKLVAKASTSDDGERGKEVQCVEFTTKEIAIKLGIADDTVARKARLAGVYREGPKGKKYSLSEVREIAKTIADSTADCKLKERCKQFLAANPVGRDVG